MSKAFGEHLYTVDFIEALPEGQRAELIDDHIYDIDMPSEDHQAIISDLHGMIWNHIRENNGNCLVRLAPYAVYLNDDDYTYVEPDILVVCDQSKIDDKGCHGAPDWIIEIVSSSSRWTDEVIKLIKYRHAGVREYWIVDSDNRAVKVYNYEFQVFERYTFEDEIPVGIWPGFSLKL